MSNRSSSRSRSRSSSSSFSSSSSSSFKSTDDEVNELVSKLQALLPQLNQRRNTTVPTSTILEETCSYIKKLRREVDSLSERLSQLLDSADIADVHELIREILQQ